MEQTVVKSSWSTNLSSQASTTFPKIG